MSGKGKGPYSWHDYYAAYVAMCASSYEMVDTVEIDYDEGEMTGIILSADILPTKPVSAESQVIKCEAYEKLSLIAKKIIQKIIKYDSNIQSPIYGRISRQRVLKLFSKKYSKNEVLSAIEELEDFVDCF
jgi:hypothetical protein